MNSIIQLHHAGEAVLRQLQPLAAALPKMSSHRVAVAVIAVCFPQLRYVLLGHCEALRCHRRRATLDPGRDFGPVEKNGEKPFVHPFQYWNRWE